jgi:predicted kinase
VGTNHQLNQGNKMSSLTLIRGLPGSGKSTMAQSMGITHFEADMFFMKDGQYQFDHTKIKEAHEWCQNQTKEALDRGEQVVVSNTFVKKWEMQPYYDMCRDVSIITLTGNYGNIHGVPEEVVERMRSNWEN